MARANMNWNQSPHTEPPAANTTSLFLIVMIRLVSVAASMNTIGT